MNDLAVERVKKGAAWLDKEQPGWFEQIDLDTLKLKDSCRCILGQLFSDFSFGMYRVMRDPFLEDDLGKFGVAHAFGFSIGHDERRYEYRDLDEAWIAEIKARYDAGFAL